MKLLTNSYSIDTSLPLRVAHVVLVNLLLVDALIVIAITSAINNQILCLMY